MNSGICATFASEYQAKEFVTKLDEISASRRPVVMCRRDDCRVEVRAAGDEALDASQTNDLKALAKDFQVVEITRLTA